MKKNIKVFAILGAMLLTLTISILPMKESNAKEYEFWGKARVVPCQELISKSSSVTTATTAGVVVMKLDEDYVMGNGHETTCEGWELIKCGGTKCFITCITTLD